jgi:RimK-like ATP-grasp domain
VTFFISVNPVASKFAKVLQTSLRAKVVDKVLRTSAQYVQRRAADKIFRITPVVLNKVEQFHAFTTNNITCPKHTTRVDFVGELGKRAFARTLINSTNGRGIIEFEPGIGDTPQAPLYTEYIPKKAEYRVHVFNGEVIDVQQKKKRRDFGAERDTRIRNLANGYVYTREGITQPEGVGTLAVNAVNAVGYMYGAVDIIFNEKRNQCFVLEVNSRPGITNSTCDSYANAIIAYYGLTRR